MIRWLAGIRYRIRLGYGRIYRITPKNKKLVVPTIDLRTSEGQLAAFKSPAINVRNQGYEKLKKKGETSIDILMPLFAKDVRGWDSLGNIRMVLAVEQRLAVRFTTSEVAAHRDVGALVETIKAKLDGRRGAS